MDGNGDRDAGHVGLRRGLGRDLGKRHAQAALGLIERNDARVEQAPHRRFRIFRAHGGVGERGKKLLRRKRLKARKVNLRNARTISGGAEHDGRLARRIVFFRDNQAAGYLHFAVEKARKRAIVAAEHARGERDHIAQKKSLRAQHLAQGFGRGRQVLETIGIHRAHFGHRDRGLEAGQGGVGLEPISHALKGAGVHQPRARRIERFAGDAASQLEAGRRDDLRCREAPIAFNG